MNYNTEQRIIELGLILPPPPNPIGLYKPILVSGNQLYVSASGPIQNDGSLITGNVGADLTLEEGRLAARQVGLTVISLIKEHFGDLNRILRLVKTLGMVNCAPGFYSAPAVMNGFSELMIEIFGDDHGKGVRSSVGMITPGNIPALIEAQFELKS